MHYNIQFKIILGKRSNWNPRGCLLNPSHLCEKKLFVYNQINYQDMKIVINEKNNKGKDIKKKSNI